MKAEFAVRRVRVALAEWINEMEARASNPHEAGWVSQRHVVGILREIYDETVPVEAIDVDRPPVEHAHVCHRGDMP